MTAALRLVEGGAERTVTQQCMICSVGHHGDCGLLARHVEHMQLLGRAELTIYQRARFLHRLAAALPVPILDATAGDLAAWRAAMRSAPETVRVNISHCRAFYQFLVLEGYRRDNPSLRLLVPRKRRAVPKPIAEADLWRALESAPPRIRPWMVLESHAGLRACEVARLTAGDLRLDGPQPVLIVSADAAKGGAERVVPLSAFVVAELRAAGIPPSGYLFRRRDGRAGPNTSGIISQLVGEHLERLGIPATGHSLRHFFGTSAYQASRDLLAVGAMMGHADPHTTQGYAQYADQVQIDAVAAIPVPPRLARDTDAG